MLLYCMKGSLQATQYVFSLRSGATEVSDDQCRFEGGVVCGLMHRAADNWLLQLQLHTALTESCRVVREKESCFIFYRYFFVHVDEIR